MAQDFLAGLERIQRKALAFQHAINQAQGAAVAVIGKDPTGAVSVHVEASGRTSHVEFTERWRSSLQSDQLAAAVVAAANDARSQGLQSYLGVIRDLPDSLSEIEVPESMLAEQEAASRRYQTTEDFPGAQHSIHEVSDMLTAAMTPPSEDLSAEPVAAASLETSEESPVGVALDGVGGIVAIAFDERWLRLVPAERIAAAITTSVHEQLNALGG